MDLHELHLPQVLPKPVKLPTDLHVALPKNSQLPLDQQHFVLFIPWDETYLTLVPTEYQGFFRHILKFLRVRTTDVHTAISVSYVDELLPRIGKPCNRRVVILSLLLHDSGWSQLTEQEVANSLGVKGLKLNETALGPKEKHALEGEKIARQVLSEYHFDPPLTSAEMELICMAIRYHDKPEAVAGADQPMPLEVQVLVDLDHLWSFTHLNFWLDTVRKGVEPPVYLENLAQDLEGYFVTPEGKQLARELLAERAQEVEVWKQA